VLQFIQNFLFALGLLDFGKSSGIRVGKQLRRERTLSAEEEDGQLLQPRLALGSDQARPPFVRRKVLSRKGKLFK